ncbi:MAG TPA: 4-(cytidine 5'-diphospho)-2-C-methyl-D-erythritol kinase [Burkholderiaceae bacterium]
MAQAEVRRLDGCLAPAKLNLFLHVTGRRADGYHTLQSVFQLLDHGDTLNFATRADGAIVRTTDLPGVPHDSDLIVRAARLLQQAHVQKHGGPAPGTEIAIVKRLPMGGGLGGGSSDAATVLMALSHLWNSKLPREQLMRLGEQLGADVPFFIFGENAFAEGIGEQLAPVATPDCWYVVIEPGVEVPTPAIFSAEELTRNTKPIKITDFSGIDGYQDGFGRNDLQAVAASKFQPVADAITWLKTYGDARMTGSGACVFCAVATEQQAEVIVAAVPARWIAWKAKSLAQHPMRAVLEAMK